MNESEGWLRFHASNKMCLYYAFCKFLTRLLGNTSAQVQAEASWVRGNGCLANMISCLFFRATICYDAFLYQHCLELVVSRHKMKRGFGQKVAAHRSTDLLMLESLMFTVSKHFQRMFVAKRVCSVPKRKDVCKLSNVTSRPGLMFSRPGKQVEEACALAEIIHFDHNRQLVSLPPFVARGKICHGF